MGGYFVCKDFIVFHKYNCRGVSEDKLLYLDARKDVDKVERFVPNQKVCSFAETASKKHLFLLAAAVVLQIFIKLGAIEPKLS